MKTYHIHIKGIVQGVGFRPFIYKHCLIKHLKGTVANSSDGVHIFINIRPDFIDDFKKYIIINAPKLAVITNISIKNVEFINFSEFKIIKSNPKAKKQLLLTPDFAICKKCEKDLEEQDNSRYNYSFTTCTNCGPRFSITKELPYDRETTTMDTFTMCEECNKEYLNPLDRRYYSQTNSCSNCRIKLMLYKDEKLIDGDFNNFNFILEQWELGKIIAIKGVGGYLLTCDANNKNTINKLRILKNRPSKPFALMYHDIYELGEDVEMGIGEKLALESPEAPIVLMSLKADRMTPLAVKEITNGLSSLGVMMPYTPLFRLLLQRFKKPIIATSANLSSSSIIFEDKINDLSKLSDFVLSNNREIVVPQDDSVVRYSAIKGYRTIVRRSRGLAPSYLNSSLALIDTSVLALGGMLKSTFTLLNNNNIHISQYLGNTDTFEGEQNYINTLKHFKALFNPKIDIYISDLHPNYFTTQLGKKFVNNNNRLIQVQHHKAHFYAVLGENNLLNKKDKVLGVIWDGTGYGDDGNIWGGEFFTYDEGKVNRVNHLNEYPFIVGDKMPKEPRISAFVMASEKVKNKLKSKFSDTEWGIYSKLKENTTIKTTSIGRLFDAVASIILDIDKQTYEGEGATQLESSAYRYFRKNNYTIYYSYLKDINKIPQKFTEFILDNIFADIDKGFDKDFIAAKFHITLANYIMLIAKKEGINKVAFSGGVFQNSWLVELIHTFMRNDFELFFHKDLSPNDENISFGQLMYYLYNQDK